MTDLDRARAALHTFSVHPRFVDALEAFEAAVRANERGGTTPAADLRERIAEAIYAAFSSRSMWEIADEHSKAVCRAEADAVLAVLPPPADRAAVLREAADVVGNDDTCDCGGCDSCVPNKLAARLREMADEAQP